MQVHLYTIWKFYNYLPAIDLHRKAKVSCHHGGGRPSGWLTLSYAWLCAHLVSSQLCNAPAEEVCLFSQFHKRQTQGQGCTCLKQPHREEGSDLDLYPVPTPVSPVKSSGPVIQPRSCGFVSHLGEVILSELVSMGSAVAQGAPVTQKNITELCFKGWYTCSRQVKFSNNTQEHTHTIKKSPKKVECCVLGEGNAKKVATQALFQSISFVPLVKGRARLCSAEALFPLHFICPSYLCRLTAGLALIRRRMLPFQQVYWGQCRFC